MKTIIQTLGEIIPEGTRCEGCTKADPYITGNEGPILKDYRGPYFCHLMEEVIEDGDKQCLINDPREELPARCYQCDAPIIPEDDDARVCIQCGGRNRRER